MFDWLKSRYTKSLEERLAFERESHAKTIEEIKKTHADELTYVKSEYAWLKDEVERLRRFLLPTMQPVYEQVRAGNSPEPPAAPPEEQGTPWQRLVRADLKAQDEAIQARKAKAKAEAEAKPAN